MDGDAYLEPGFDPNTLKVAELRGILLKHDVDYPSAAKKAVLLDLFNEHIGSKAAQMRAESLQVQPSSRGMINAGETPEKVDYGVTPRRVRRSTRGATEDTTEDDDDHQQLRSTRKSVGRTPSRKKVSDVETPTTLRKTRKSSARLPSEDIAPTPIKQEVKQEDEGPETPFSSYNPFQMGSPAPGLKPDTDRRKTLGVPGTVKKRSTSSRRRTEGLLPSDAGDYSTNGAGSVAKRRASSRLPVDDIRPVSIEPSIHDDFMEPGEEFEPEEAAELAAIPPEQSVIRRQPRPRSNAGRNSLLVSISIILLAYAIWWRQEKIDVGYCGVGGLDMRKHTDNELLQLVRPECEPCPPHARCYPGMELECVDDYIKVNSYASFGGLWPVPPMCVPDTEKERRISIMSDAALDVLRKNGAEQRCKEKFLSGELNLEGVSEADLRQVLYDRKAPSLSDREFSELFRHALEDVSNRDEVAVETDTNGVTKYKSRSLAALPLGCSIKLFIAGSVARHRGKLSGMIALLLAGVLMRAKLAAKKDYDIKVAKLVHYALSQLAVNAIQHPEHPSIAVAHLRDQILQREFSAAARTRLWRGVERIVEQNSNIRAGEREIQGEIMRVWTWIGGNYIDGKSVFEIEPHQQELGSSVVTRRNRPIA